MIFLSLSAKFIDKKISFFNFKGYIIKGKSTNYLGYTIKGYIKGYKDIEAIKNKRIALLVALIAMIIIIFQTVNIHPYYLAYYNPLVEPPVKMGFGEGIELAAKYLETKEKPEDLIVSSWYPDVMATYFPGTILGLDSIDKADYVVLYRGMKGRAEIDPATRIINSYETMIPDKTIYLNNLEYVWIYEGGRNIKSK